MGIIVEKLDISFILDQIEEQESIITLQNCLLLEATSNYPDTLISITATPPNNNWYKTHEELHKQGLYMPTIRQFVDFIKLLKTGKAFNSDGTRVPSLELEQILNENIASNFPWKTEWLDAEFKVISGISYINYNHRTINGQLEPQNSEPLLPILKQNINLEYWLNNATSQGLPQTNSSNKDTPYLVLMSDKDYVAGIGVDSVGVSMNIIKSPIGTNFCCGVRPCAPKI